MLRASLVIFFILAAALTAFAQEDFKPGSEDTLKWVEPDEGFRQMLEEAKPGVLYVYSSHKPDFCKAVEKDIIPSKTLNRQFKKFVCIKHSSDAEAELIVKYKVEQGDVAVLFLDCQGKVVESIREKPEASEFSAAFRKTDKANKTIKKFLDSVEKNYDKGEAYFKKQFFHKAAQLFMAILKARDDYEEKKGEINSPFFAKAEAKIEQIKEEGTKALIRANAAVNKDDFANASVLLSKARAEFALFPDIMQKVEQAEQELQRRMQRAQQQGGGK